MAVDPETFDKLCQIEDKLVPVSVVGLYRTGKSYLLNRLAGKTSGLSTLPSFLIFIAQNYASVVYTVSEKNIHSYYWLSVEE